jgi:hypothetical protein
VWFGVANVFAIIVLALLCASGFYVAVVLLRGTREWCDRGALTLGQCARQVF